MYSEQTERFPWSEQTAKDSRLINRVTRTFYTQKDNVGILESKQS